MPKHYGKGSKAEEEHNDNKKVQKTVAVEKKGELRRRSAEKERREKQQKGKLSRSVKDQLREQGLVDRSTVTRDVDGNTGQPVGQPLSVTGRSVSIIAKEVNEATQATLTITGAQSGAVKVVTLTIQPGTSLVNSDIDGQSSPFRDYMATP